jgi:hypothetical protein
MGIEVIVCKFSLGSFFIEITLIAKHFKQFVPGQGKAI